MNIDSSVELYEALEEFLKKSSILVRESMISDHDLVKSYKQNFKNLNFYREALKELGYIDTQKGLHLMNVITHDSFGQNKKNNKNNFAPDFETVDIKNRANFIYLHSLFERLLVRIYRYGFQTNTEFQNRLKSRFKLKYDDLVIQGRKDEQLETALFNDQSKLPDLIGKLDYTPLFNLIELLNLRKGHFKKFIEVSYEIDIYRVIRNSITHRDDITDEIFYKEIDNIKGVNGQLGDAKNKRFKNDTLKRILKSQDYENLEKRKQTRLNIGGVELIRCLGNFIQISAVAIILLEEEKTNIDEIRKIFSNSFMHEILHAFHKSKDVNILLGCLDVDMKLETCFSLLSSAIDEIKSREGVEPEKEKDDYDDVYLVNKILLLYELKKNTSVKSNLKETIKKLSEKITDETISRLIENYLEDNIEEFVIQLQELEKNHDLRSMDTWYMVLTKKDYKPVADFIENHVQSSRLANMRDELEYSKRIKKKQGSKSK